MSDTRQVIPIGGLALTVCFAAFMAAQLHAQTVVLSGNSQVAEVHDEQGQVLLRGQFGAPDDQDADDTEQVATLMPVGNNSKMTGEAEVEVSKGERREQEIEFSVRNLTAGQAVTFVIDGQTVGKATADRDGEAEFEVVNQVQ